MQIDPYNAIYAKLTADQTAGSLYADVSGRIRLDEGEQDLAIPILLYTPVTDVPDVYLTAPDDLEFVFQLDLYTRRDAGQEAALATNQKLIALLHRQSVAVTNHGNGQAWCTDKGVPAREPDDAWRITSQWKLTASANS